MKGKLKRILYIALPSAALIGIVLVTIAITHGWYTNIDKMGQIDANTKNSGFKYEINGETLETDEYSISNLVFFDIDSIYEGKYFSTMVYEMEIDIENITDDNLTYSLKFEGFRQSANSNTISYVGCIMSPTKLGYEVQTTGKADTTYYTYNSDTHEYTEYSGTVTNNQDLTNVTVNDEAVSLYAYNSDFIDDIYVLTSDSTVDSNKKYYKQVSTNSYLEHITAGTKIPTGSEYYEKVYTQATEYSNSGTYYEIHTSSNGSAFYTVVDNDKVTSSNYLNYYVLVDNIYQLSTDVYFQNETYYLRKENNGSYTYTELTTLTPGDTTANKNYYECGKKVESLIQNDSSLGITYTTNASTEDPFTVEYTSGSLGPKSGTKKNQKLYLYLFGVQEIDSAKYPEFIEFIHNFRITISATTESSWTVEDDNNNNTPDSNGDQGNGDNNG